MSVWSWFRDRVHNQLFSKRTFEFFQKIRINITKNYHSSPIPDVRNLQRDRIWEQETKLPGIELRDAEQLRQIEQVVAQYHNECKFTLNPTSVPYEYYMRNRTYGWLCALIYHSFIRHYKSRKIIELGAGSSTYIAARAAGINHANGIPTELIAVDPFPNLILKKGFPGLSQVLAQRAEELTLDFFAGLADGDILFIDSTHTVKIGGDVTFLFLEVLPRLKPGVLV